MLDNNSKEQLIDEFSTLLDSIQNDSDSLPYPEKTVDLFSLFKELGSLKTEVKQESRQFKMAIDSFKTVFDTLQKSHDILSEELMLRRQEQAQAVEQQKSAILKPILLQLIELRERLSLSTSNQKSPFSKWFATIFKRQIAFTKALIDGQSITLKRVDDLLALHDVQPGHALQTVFNPEWMCAVGVEHHPELQNGWVLSEINKGFFWKNEILRIAEVIVNKAEE